MDDLVGVREIAARLGVKRQSVHNWRERHDDFPAPLTEKLDQLVWEWPEVEEWLRKTGRLDA